MIVVAGGMCLDIVAIVRAADGERMESLRLSILLQLLFKIVRLNLFSN
jgi:hypothetical protein